MKTISGNALENMMRQSEQAGLIDNEMILDFTKAGGKQIHDSFLFEMPLTPEAEKVLKKWNVHLTDLK